MIPVIKKKSDSAKGFGAMKPYQWTKIVSWNNLNTNNSEDLRDNGQKR